MKIIAKYFSGSVSYGLLTKDSDVDVSFLFIHDEISKILGLDRHDHQNHKDDTIDSQGYEIRHFLGLLRKGTTGSLEMLHNEVWLEKSPEMDYIQSKRKFLLDSDRIYKVLRAYSYSERQLIFARAHQGRIGEKRKKAIEQYNYSFRNASHAIRLIRAGVLFFKTDKYPVNIIEADKEYGQLIYSIKTNPSSHKPEDIEARLIDMEKELDTAYEKRATHYKFDDKVANEICYNLYLPILITHEKRNTNL